MVVDIGKCSCPHVFTSGGRRYISYSKEGIVYTLDLLSGERKKLCYGDEYVALGGDRFLLRNGQKFTETENLL